MVLVTRELDAEWPVEGISKAEVNAVLLQSLTERNMLKGTVKPVEMTEIHFQ